MVAYFSTEILHTQLAFNSDDQLTRLLYTGTLLMTNRLQITSTNKIAVSLFRTLLNLTMVFVSYRGL